MIRSQTFSTEVIFTSVKLQVARNQSLTASPYKWNFISGIFAWYYLFFKDLDLKKIMDFQIFSFYDLLSSSIIQCKSAKRNHVLHWVTTTQPSELNELKTNCIVRTISLQIQLLPLARHKLTNVLTLFQVLVRSLVRVSSSTNNDSAKNTTFPLNESHLWTLHTSYLLTYIYQIRISF